MIENHKFIISGKANLERISYQQPARLQLGLCSEHYLHFIRVLKIKTSSSDKVYIRERTFGSSF